MEEKVIEFRIHVPRIHFSPRVWKWSLAGLLILALAENPATESVTLTTYYPSPAGVYNNLLSIGNSWFARDPLPGGGLSFVELGNNIFGNPNNDIKLDVENGAIRLTQAQGGSTADHWIGTGGAFGPGNSLALYGKAGGGVEIGTNNQAAMTVNSNQGVEFMHSITVGPYTTTPSPSQQYIHINSNSACMQMGPGADNYGCPGGWYATWTPGIYVETPGGYYGKGWAHDRYALYARNPANGSWLNTNADCDVGWDPLSFRIYAQFPNWGPGMTQVCVAGEGLFNSNGGNRWWCCPK